MIRESEMPRTIPFGDIDLYALFIRLLEKPRQGLEHLIVNESLPDLLQQLSAHLGLEHVPDFDMPQSMQDAESRYLALFEVGLPVPPCPLNEAPYCRSEPPTRIIHENLLFYRMFDLDLSRDNRELPDHILNQLEFLSYLTRLMERTVQPETRVATRAAKDDFIERHLLSWVPKARLKLNALDEQLYETIFALLELCLRKDRTPNQGDASYDSA
ncbi:MAG: molecular chaperone TorD family protein [Armatimonadetes bacterium]|nr:molecular chaperone TorD family protein [Armatimonadota bacterium]